MQDVAIHYSTEPLATGSNSHYGLPVSPPGTVSIGLVRDEPVRARPVHPRCSSDDKGVAWEGSGNVPS